MPVNKGDNRALDCAVIQFIHQSNKEEKGLSYDVFDVLLQKGLKLTPVLL